MSADGEAAAAPIRRQAAPGVHEAVVARFRNIPRGLVLDVPCGRGALTRDLQQLGFRVISGDIDADCFALSPGRMACLDLNAHLPFRDSSFDAVAAVEGIEHLENPFQFLREIARVLRPGGEAILTTPNIWSVKSRFKAFFASYHYYFKTIEKDGHISPIGIRELLWGVDRAGLCLRAIGANEYRKKLGPLYPLIKALIRAYTKHKNPQAELYLSREVLEGMVLVLHLQKPGAE